MERIRNPESQVVAWSVAVLCATLLLVYIVQYFAKWDIRKQSLTACDETNTSTWIVLSQLTWDPKTTNNSSYFMDNTWSKTNNSNTWTLVELTWNTNTTDVITEYPWEMIILPWTKTYYWTLDFVEKLWINYKYALVDEKWIYYLNMWDYKYDFSDIARKLWWNLYIMNTEQEIIQNSMFGDKVTYINIPEYKNIKVLILLDINSQSWLLDINYSIYHQVKDYLKSLFTNQ